MSFKIIVQKNKNKNLFSFCFCMGKKTKKDRYMAPEVFKHRKYDKKVDVFSFAMILYEVMLVATLN